MRQVFSHLTARLVLYFAESYQNHFFYSRLLEPEKGLLYTSLYITIEYRLLHNFRALANTENTTLWITLLDNA
jgi:hypothetical protein